MGSSPVFVKHFYRLAPPLGSENRQTVVQKQYSQTKLIKEGVVSVLKHFVSTCVTLKRVFLCSKWLVLVSPDLSASLISYNVTYP